MSSTLSVLPGPAGQPARYCRQVAFDPTGRYLVAVLAAGADGPGTELVLYRRDGDALTRLADPLRWPGEGPPSTVAWTPDGLWLAVTTHDPDGSAVPTAAKYLTHLYQRTGDLLRPVGPAVPDEQGYQAWGVFAPGSGRITFDATGQWLLHVSPIRGYMGLVRRSGAILTPAVNFYGVSGAFGNDFLSEVYEADWHPSDPTLLVAYLVGYNPGNQVRTPRVSLLRFNGSTAIAEYPYEQIAVSDWPRWHPSGRWLALQYRQDDTTYGPTAVVYTPPHAQSYAGPIDALNSAYLGHSFDPSGTYMAGQVSTDRSGNYLGFTVAALTGAVSPGHPPVSEPLLPRQPGVAGRFSSWASDTGGLYVAAGGGFNQAGGVYTAYTPPGGFALLRLDPVTAPTATSKLAMADSGGVFTGVGVDGRPLAMVLDGGAVRTWPGAAQPLYQCQADGTWVQVLG